jgi:hypothetical protein
MSILISISRRASAFRTAAGIFYALFETTYPKNACSPNPVTQCVAFGTVAHITSWIFSGMAQCQSGLLQSVNGLIDPMDYRRFWQHALRRPDRLFTQPVWIRASRQLDATIPMESDVFCDGNRLPFATELLQLHGYSQIAARIAAGEEVIMDLHRDAAVLADIYGGANETRIQPWRIIQCEGTGEGDPSLAPVMSEIVRPALPAQVFHLDHQSRLCALIPGQRGMVGTRDELMHEFISRVAVGYGLATDNALGRAIQAFGDALAGAHQALPSNIAVVIEPLAIKNMALYRAKYEAIVASLGARAKPVSLGIQATATALRKADMLSTVADLPSHCLRFVYIRHQQAISATEQHALAA